jgi:hypothetical protein
MCKRSSTASRSVVVSEPDHLSDARSTVPTIATSLRRLTASVCAAVVAAALIGGTARRSDAAGGLTARISVITPHPDTSTPTRFRVTVHAPAGDRIQKWTMRFDDTEQLTRSGPPPRVIPHTFTRSRLYRVHLQVVDRAGRRADARTSLTVVHGT